MSKKEIKSLEDRYNQYVQKKGKTYRPTAEDVSVYREWLNDDITAERAAKIMGVKHAATALKRFAMIQKSLVKAKV